ncbi:MAG: DNA polymerase I, partial [Geobacter sp.]
FDVKGQTFRHIKYAKYKGKRPPTDENLIQQIPKVKEILTAFGIKILEKQGFEADDLIGFAAKSASSSGSSQDLEIIIITGDLDTLQLINNKVKVYALRKGVKDIVLYDENLVKEKYLGLKPSQLVDFKALRGDPSDNIIGVSGIGEKTAIELLNKFESLDNLYRKIEESSDNTGIISPKIKKMLIDQKEQAYLSKLLVKIETDIPVDFNFEDCHWRDYDKEKAKRVLKNYEFNSLIDKLP